MATVTARKLITKAMQKAGIITKDEAPANDEIRDGLDSLNDMLSSWSNDSLICIARARENFTLTGGVGLYTLGPGGTLNTTRPLAYTTAAIIMAGGQVEPVGIVTDEIFEQQISFPPAPGLPDVINFDNGYPLCNVRLWPVPNSAYTLRLMTEKPLQEYGLDDLVELPPGWNRAIWSNLGVDLCPEYGQQVPPALQNIADDSIGDIKLAIAKARSMDSNPPMSGRQDNVYSGWRN